jgi:hypothetical protein
MPLLAHCLVAAQSLALLAPAPDTLRLEVGSPEVDGRIYAPHAARVIVRVGAPDGPQRAEWTNELTLGDSAGRRVMRWVTRGTQSPTGGGAPVTWELHQTYDAVTLAPYGIVRRSSNGAASQFVIDGRTVRGTTRAPGDSVATPVEYELDRLGFVASASDLVPLAVGLKEGLVMTAPVWGPAMRRAEMRVFSVLGEVPVTVEGKSVRAWKVEERRQADGALTATWYLTTASPYMVYGEVPLPDGRVQYMSEVEIPRSGR